MPPKLVNKPGDCITSREIIKRLTDAIQVHWSSVTVLSDGERIVCLSTRSIKEKVSPIHTDNCHLCEWLWPSDTSGAVNRVSCASGNTNTTSLHFRYLSQLFYIHITRFVPGMCQLAQSSRAEQRQHRLDIIRCPSGRRRHQTGGRKSPTDLARHFR